MKRKFGFIMAIATLVTLLASGGLVQAYTVSGDLSSSGFPALAGSVSYTGSLSGLFNTSGGEALYINNNLPTGKYNDMVANQDYVVVTSSSGATATFSVGEFTVGNTGNHINITGNAGTGYTVTSTDSTGAVYQSLSNVTNINVVHTNMPAGPRRLHPRSRSTKMASSPPRIPVNFPGTLPRTRIRKPTAIPATVYGRLPSDAAQQPG